MGIRRIAGNDATAARRLARSGELPTNARANEEPRRSSIEKLRPGSDPSQAIADLYAVGRKVYGRNPDARRDERTPQYRTPTPSRDAYSASYGVIKDSPVTPAPDEQTPQFRDDKCAGYNDVREAWTRGMANEQHPFFDRGGSGDRYRK
jgi:hypothetical protein